MSDAAKQWEDFARTNSSFTRIQHQLNYIATYSAHCVDGSAIQANLALSSVPAGTSPGSMIEMVTEQAYADIARSGKNATHVVVLNLSRVW